MRLAGNAWWFLATAIEFPAWPLLETSETNGTIETGQNRNQETIETSETIKTIEWWTSAYLRRQTKEVEIINRCPPIIHSSTSRTETRRSQILENPNDHSDTSIFWHLNPKMLRFKMSK